MKRERAREQEKERKRAREKERKREREKERKREREKERELQIIESTELMMKTHSSMDEGRVEPYSDGPLYYRSYNESSKIQRSQSRVYF